MTSQLKEEVSSQHPDYYFSAPNRIRNKLWLVGKKRQKGAMACIFQDNWGYYDPQLSCNQ